MSELVNRTFSVDKQAHKDFKAECAHNGVDMSQTIESFMMSYVKVSREARMKQHEQENE